MILVWKSGEENSMNSALRHKIISQNTKGYRDCKRNVTDHAKRAMPDSQLYPLTL